MIFLRKFISFIFISLILLWGIVALVRMVYNFSKLWTEERRLFFVSDEKKREMTYGETYTFCNFLKSNTGEHANILFLSSSGKVFYLCRYLAYPRKLFYVRSTVEAEHILKQESFDYILVYKSTDPSFNENNSSLWILTKYNLIFTYKSHFKSTGGLYKL